MPPSRATRIRVHNQVNIGIAVARETGLLTVVIRDCDLKSLPQIGAEAREVVGRAREGRMKPDDMVGATFTISNLGMFDVEDFIAIINPPQAAILAVGAVKRCRWWTQMAAGRGHPHEDHHLGRSPGD